MIEILFRRKMIREILNRYSNSFWHQLVPYIMEIGILYVSRNYNIAELSVEDYKYILGKKNHLFKLQKIWKIRILN